MIKLNIILSLLLFISSAVKSQSPCLNRIIEESLKIDTIQFSTGTGFLINNQGYIATNRHVIERAKELYVTFTIDQKKYRRKAKVITWDLFNDIAILKADITGIFKKLPVINFYTKELNPGDPIFTMGYPSPGVMGEKIKLTNGIVNSTSGFQDDESSYQISAPIQPGNSGSPLFDKYGNIRGIIVASFTRGQNVNYAIKASYIKKLASTIKVVPQTSLSNESIGTKINNLQSTVCLIENISPKVYYSEFECKENRISKLEYYYGCSDKEMKEYFLSKDVPLKTEIIEKTFTDSRSVAFFWNLYSYYIDYKNPPRYFALFNIGAYENIIDDIEGDWVIDEKNIDKLDEAGLEMFFRLDFEIYYNSYIQLYGDYDHRKIEFIDRKIEFLHMLLLSKKNYNYLADVTFWGKLQMMQVLQKYKKSDMCEFIRQTQVLIDKNIITTIDSEQFLIAKQYFCK